MSRIIKIKGIIEIPDNIGDAEFADNLFDDITECLGNMEIDKWDIEIKTIE